jgi:hypothetical protein
MYKDLKEYEAYLRSLAESKSPDIFTNSGLQHASILMAEMFRNTNSSVKMFCHGFKPQLITTKEYTKALYDYLDSDKSIDILMETDEYMNQEAYTTLAEYKKKNPGKPIKIKLILPDDRKEICNTLGREFVNFSVFDDDKFRLEIEPEKYRAIGSFNNPKLTKMLIDMFDKAFNKAKTLSN